MLLVRLHAHVDEHSSACALYLFTRLPRMASFENGMIRVSQFTTFYVFLRLFDTCSAPLNYG
jgi:hypothetical protein